MTSQTKLTQETEDVVARLGAWSNDPDDEPPIVLMMAAKSAILGLSDRIDVLEGALREIAETMFVPYGEAETIDEIQRIARASLRTTHRDI